MDVKTTQATDTSKRRLSAEDWAQAALDAMADGGLESVAVERLARELGVTKGSFYWHFSNREAVVRAAIDLWAKHETDDIIELAEAETDPRKRIQRIYKVVNGSERAGRLYLALAAASSDPMVGKIVEKVSRRRLEYLNNCYLALGLDEREARKWSTFAYSTYLGTLQVRRDDPRALSDDNFFPEYVRHLITMLLPRELPSAEIKSGSASSEAATPAVETSEAGNPTGLAA